MGKITINKMHNSLFDYAQVVSDESLMTESKTIVGAINEIYGKQLIADSIGEPLNNTDTFTKMSDDINSLLSIFKTNMMNAGVAVENSDKFKSLINKIKGLTEGEGNKGIQYAEGIFGQNSLTKSQEFTLELNFVPSLFFIGPLSVNDYSDGTFVSNIYVSNLYQVDVNNPHFTGESGHIIFSINNLSQNGLLFNISNPGAWDSSVVGDFNWYAIGVGEEDTALRDSLASILEDEGVNVTEEDTMADLIVKTDEEFDRQVVPQGTAVASNVLTGKTFINSTGETITGTMSQLTSNIANVTTNAPKHYQTDKVTIKDLSGLGGICTYFQVPTNTNTGNIQWIMSYTPDLIAANIVSGKSILGVNGTASISRYPVWHNPENTWMHISTAKLVYCPSDSKMSVVLGDDIYIFTTSRYCKYSTKTNVCSESIAYTNVPSTSELSRGDFTVVNCNGLFYFIGGLKSYSSDRQNANNYLMTFNPSNNTWTTKANMITALNQALACVYNNKIYVFGGCTYKEYYSGNYSYGRSNKSSKYDPSTNTWTSITDVPKYKTLPPIVVNNCAYLPGTGGTTTRYKYDFSTGTYTEFTSGLSLSTGVAYKNRIYSFGASSSTRRTTMYDTTTGTETDKAICNVNKSGGSAHAMGDLIYYLGGNTKNSNGYYINAYYYGDIYIPEK